MKVSGRLAGAGLVAAIAALLSLPAGAVAKPGYEVENRSLHLTMHAAAANGYRLTVETRGHRQVLLTVSRGDTFVIYRTTGSISRRGIKVDLGSLGRISVRFAGERQPFELFPGLNIPLPPGLALPHRDCHGKRPVREVGRFRGTIQFRGENGFTRLQTHRARGEVGRFYRRVCKRGSLTFSRPRQNAGLFAGVRINLLVATDHSRNRTVGFEALDLAFGPGDQELDELLGAIAVTWLRERREGLRILRGAIASGDEGSLLTSPPQAQPVTATVALPESISGTAEYRKEVGSPASWVGSLEARLPGAGVVPLTGPGFSATLCRMPLAQLAPPFDNRCLRRSGAALPESLVVGTAISAQISGSQSQLFGDARLSWSR